MIKFSFSIQILLVSTARFTRIDEFNFKRFLILLVLLVLGCDTTTSNEKYIFFLHNRFLETHHLNNAHPEYGKVAYKAIINAFKKEGFNVISEQRQGNVNARDYAEIVVLQIDSLLLKHVKAKQTTVVGTSKGGYIAQYVSTIANNPKLNFVFIGSFREQDIVAIPEINFCGNILNIYETSDPFGVSALKRKETSTCKISHYKDLELNTGLQHGFLFQPIDEWILPTIKWANGDYSF